MMNFILLAAIIFTVVAVVNLIRLVRRWPITVAGVAIPVALSWLGLAVAGGMAIWAWRLVAI